MKVDALFALKNSLPGSPLDRALDRLVRESQAELTASAICPLCRGPLVARYHPARGPYFHCYCFQQNLHPPCPPLRKRGTGGVEILHANKNVVSKPKNCPSEAAQLQEDHAQEYADERTAQHQAGGRQKHALAASANGGGSLPQSQNGRYQT